MTDGKIGTGFIGTPAILPALVKIGAVDLAEKLFLQPDVPGWLYQVEQGATTIWERWDAIRADGTIYDPDMNSYNHYAYGAVCQWLFEGVAGLPARPGACPASAASSSSRPSCPRSASCGRATTRPPAGSRRPGRSRTARSTTRSPCRRAPRALLVLGPGHADPSLDGESLAPDADGMASRRRLGARLPPSRAFRLAGVGARVQARREKTTT